MRARFAALALTLALATAAQAQPAFSPAPWLQDLDQLRDAMSERYPNLEWAVERGMDLPATYARARARLLAARDEYQARRALERFVQAFADGHFEIGWPAPPAPAPAASNNAPPPPLCQRLGYAPENDAAAIATRLPGFAPTPGEAVMSSGVVTVEGRRVGVLRVPLFQAQAYPALCARILAEARLTPQSPCDDACQASLDLAGDRALAEEMRRRLTALVAARADVLLLDLAGNGGGNDSALVLAKLVTDKTVRKPRAGLIKAAATEQELAARHADVQVGLKAARGPERAPLQHFDAALARARREALTPCDRSPLWQGKPIACTGVVEEPVYDGPLPVAGQPAWVEVASPLARYGAADPVWRGPVIVLVDWNSASATELLAAVLQDAGAAIVLGSPTFGAGCGHMTSAGPLTLANSRATVSMPDCLRYRANGVNEAAAVQPDVPIGFRTYDTPKQRLELLQRALPAAVARATGGDRTAP